MVQRFMELVKQIQHYHEAIATLSWDLRTGAPRKGASQRAEVIGFLSAQAFQLSTSKEMETFLGELSSPSSLSQLNPVIQSTIRECNRNFIRNKQIPADLYQEYVVLTTQAENIWEVAKEEADFNLFQPYLEKIIQFNHEFIQYWGYQEHPYNTLLDHYEPGMTVKKLDQTFSELRRVTVDLLSAIKASSYQTNPSLLTQEYDKNKQREFSLYILQQMGYDFEAGRLDVSVHPFATGLNPNDVRITTRFDPKDFRTALFGSIHEGGHALYEQNIDQKLIGTPLAEGTSMGIHESQSRFLENMIGRGKAFWSYYYPKLTQVFPEQLSSISAQQFFEAINHVEPSLIRVEADELTYNLHIMLRYEMEKALFGKDIKVSELPQIWNEKMKDYLGIVPSHDGEGVLQDIHWAGGAFGYFPSYSLGNIYAAQIEHTLRKNVSNYEDEIQRGNLLPVKEWLSEQIYQYGKSLTPAEIMVKVTGEEINPNYLVDYLKNKYKDVYRL